MFFKLIYIAVRSSLEADGHLGQIKAEIRTKVMKLLDKSSVTKEVKKPMNTNVLLINELIREYLNWMGYQYTSSVFVAGEN